MARLFLRSLSLLVAVGVSVAVLEAAVQRFDPLGVSYYRDILAFLRDAVVPAPNEDGQYLPTGRLFDLKPGVDLEYHGFSMKTDALGFRSGESGAPVAERTGTGDDDYRILFLGDSVTLAWGVDDADTWIRMVERDGRSADDRSLECLNAGRLMYDTTQEADALRVLGPAVRPDLVAVMFVVNDIVSTFDSETERLLREAEAREAAGWLQPLKSFFRDRLPGLSGLSNFRTATVSIAQFPDWADRELEDLDNYPEGWPRCEAALDDMRRTCSELGADLVVLDHSMPQLPEVEAWCDATGTPYVRTAFSPDEWSDDILNSAVDTHANPAGNRIIADKVLFGLARHGFLRM